MEFFISVMKSHIHFPLLDNGVVRSCASFSRLKFSLEAVTMNSESLREEKPLVRFPFVWKNRGEFFA